MSLDESFVCERSALAIVIFAYNRPEHFSNCLEKLIAEFGEKKLNWYVFVDGAKCLSSNKNNMKIVNIANSLLEREIALIKLRPLNVGLKNSVILGVTEVLEYHERVIVFEDDLEVKRGSYRYFVSALEKYESNTNIVQVSGFSYNKFNDNMAYFLPLTTSWGWGTWKDRWFDFIDKTLSNDCLSSIHSVDKGKFNFDNSYNFYGILSKELRGEVSSWAILFYFHAYRFNLLTLYPPYSLISNNGFDGSGTHGSIGVGDHYAHGSVTEDVVSLPDAEAICISQEKCKFVGHSLQGVSKFRRFLRIFNVLKR